MRRARLLFAAAAVILGLGMTGCASPTGPCDASDPVCHSPGSGNHSPGSGNHSPGSGNYR
jgi:hypothetical protein